jgi:hypothetical protein
MGGAPVVPTNRIWTVAERPADRPSCLLAPLGRLIATRGAPIETLFEAHRAHFDSC